MDQHVDELEGQIKHWHRENEARCKLVEIPGIGPITVSALAASVGDGKTFKNGRQLAAWLGLVPRQHSTGGKSTLLGISKRGDTYLCTLLIHGARSVVRVAQAKTELTGSWLQGLLGRRNANVATVAQANKNARIAWALRKRQASAVLIEDDGVTPLGSGVLFKPKGAARRSSRAGSRRPD